MAEATKSKKNEKTNESKEAKAIRKAREAAPDVQAVGTRLAELKGELATIAESKAELESQEERTQAHFDALHAAYFGGDFGIIVGGIGSDDVDVPADWDAMMGEVPDAEDETEAE